MSGFVRIPIIIRVSSIPATRRAPIFTVSIIADTLCGKEIFPQPKSLAGKGKLILLYELIYPEFPDKKEEIYPEIPDKNFLLTEGKTLQIWCNQDLPTFIRRE